MLFCVLLFVADFSETQSFVLAAIAVLFYVMLRLRTIHRPTFVPYQMSVRPNLHLICTDFEFVEDTEESWAKIHHEIDKLPKAPWNLWYWNSGFSVSFVSPELIYDNTSNSFATEVDLYASLKPIVIPWTEEKGGFHSDRGYSPSLHFQGHRLSIELLTWHWEKVRRKEVFKNIDKDADVSLRGEGLSVRVQLAIIPYAEFDVHLPKGSEEFLKEYEKALKRREESRARYGWKGKADTGRYGEDIPADHSSVIEHKYFTLSHSAL